MKNLRNLYLQDLKQMVSYNGGKTFQPKVRHISNYERIPAIEQLDISKYENIWIWSDIHFGHNNIIKYANRPFTNWSVMNEKLIENHNSVVGPNDLVIWVGDVAFMSDHKTNELLARLNGERILIIGNHDLDKGQVKNLDFKEKHLIFTMETPTMSLVFTHYPFDLCPDDWINVHGHIHEKHTDNLRQINVSVEVIDYTPIHLDRLLEIAKIRLDSMD